MRAQSAYRPLPGRSPKQPASYETDVVRHHHVGHEADDRGGNNALPYEGQGQRGVTCKERLQKPRHKDCERKDRRERNKELLVWLGLLAARWGGEPEFEAGLDVDVLFRTKERPYLSDQLPTRVGIQPLPQTLHGVEVHDDGVRVGGTVRPNDIYPW